MNGEMRVGTTERARRLADSGDRESADVAKQFEAMLLKTVVQSLHRTVGQDGLFGGESGTQLYEHFVEEALATAVADSGGIGLRRLFEERTPGELPTAAALAVRYARPAAFPGAPATALPDQEALQVLAQGPAGAASAQGQPLSALQPPTDDPWLDSPNARALLQDALTGGQSASVPAKVSR
jgi:Rod binding domain-containing protein